jgi:predicted membrane-bound dolichyl-phosphate-mannose-protein mannosyltransferase
MLRKKIIMSHHELFFFGSLVSFLEVCHTCFASIFKISWLSCWVGFFNSLAQEIFFCLALNFSGVALSLRLERFKYSIGRLLPIFEYEFDIFNRVIHFYIIVILIRIEVISSNISYKIFPDLIQSCFCFIFLFFSLFDDPLYI